MSLLEFWSSNNWQYKVQILFSGILYDRLPIFMSPMNILLRLKIYCVSMFFFSEAEERVKQERCANAGMQKQLRAFQTLIEDAEQAKQEAKNIAKVLENYKNVKAVVNGG